MEQRKYAYMVEQNGKKIGIMYHLGKYCVAVFAEKDTGMMAYTLRQYKTLSGAERFLLRDYSYAKKNAPHISYNTAEFIKEGSYWKGV